MHSLPGHVGVYRLERRQASSLLAAPVTLPGFERQNVRAGTRLACLNLRSFQMKRITCFSAVVVLLLLGVSGPAQTTAGSNEQQLLALVKEVQVQQAQIASNQTKIEAKVAEVAEAVRVARVFASRGGK